MSHWRRTRMISFRVSEREFELLKSKSEAEGARNISDFARVALCGRTDHDGRPTANIDQLRDELQELSAYVRRVAEMLDPKRPPVPAQRSQLAAVGRKTGNL